MGTISGIHHAKLPVSDVARSRDWYVRVLGFEVDIEFVEEGVLRGIALRHPGGSASLALRHDPDRAAAMNGFDALALLVPSHAEVTAWQARLDTAGEKHGGVVTGHAGGRVLVGLTDPDGIEIRLYADREGRQSELTVDGATIAWSETGAGDPVLLVHAGLFSAWFDPVAPMLNGRRAIRMVRAGYTDTPPPPVSIAGHAAHCAALLDALETGPATIVGHSTGSAIALQLALDRPDLVRDLVLVEPPLLEPLLDPADIDAVLAALGPVLGAAVGAAQGGDLPAAFDAFLGAVVGPNSRGALVDALGADAVAEAERRCGYFFSDEIPAAWAWTFDAAARITAPTLLVQGADSPAPTHRLVARLASLLPDAHVATVDGADHLLPLTHPAQLAELVTAPAGVR